MEASRPRSREREERRTHGGDGGMRAIGGVLDVT